FTPASAEIATAARPVLDELAGILVACPPMQLEIGGYTDAQGSEGGNQALSQARAEAVLLALQGRRVDISGMTAVGYGEARPIAENDTEEGREANRRIEFVLQGVPAGSVAMGAGGAERAEARLETPAEPGATPTEPAGTDPAILPGPDADLAETGVATPAAAAMSGDAGSSPTGPAPDFSGDTSPSVAPTEKTIRPLPRPEDLEAEESQ
ncbi:MAG: OmpA family protein, partial [Rhodobacterales bacterium]|nr:OmpA family protein [Rhodobacterales bacterium]